MITWVNGAFVEGSTTVAISPADGGVSSGRGVFETLRFSEGSVICRSRHLGRLVRSAAIVGISPQLELVGRGLDAVAAQAAEDTGPQRVRITVTAGGLVIVTASALPHFTAARVTVSPWVRNERGPLVGAKCTSYAENAVAFDHAISLGFDEALLYNSVGHLSEGTRTNVFLGIGRQLVTPPLSSGCLPGVIRGLLIEMGVAEEGDIFAADLAKTGEAFLTSSLRVVQPIRSIDSVRFGDVPGPLTARARVAIDEWLAADRDA
jgi:branched-chain amino acid aminotransferase